MPSYKRNIKKSVAFYYSNNKQYNRSKEPVYKGNNNNNDNGENIGSKFDKKCAGSHENIYLYI